MLDTIVHNVLICLLVNPPLSACERRSCCSRLSDWLHTGSVQSDKFARKCQWRRYSNLKTLEQNASIACRHLLQLLLHVSRPYLNCSYIICCVYFYRIVHICVIFSVKRKEEYEALCGVDMKHVLKHTETRWLSLQRCIDRMLNHSTSGR